MNCRKLSILLISVFALSGIVSCGEVPSSEATSQPTTSQTVTSNTTSQTTTSQQVEEVDYAGQVKLDLSSSTAKFKVTKVKNYVDGDTTHFEVPTTEDPFDEGVLKARYLAINTPESTGKIEPYGKKASNFTKEKLKGAYEIYVESDDENWNADSTGSRFMSWVWYRNSATEDFRNLNIEILQNGLAIASNTANNRYGTTAVAALNQAKALKLNVFSGKQDPDFYTGKAIVLSMSELREDIASYVGKDVAVEGVIASMGDNGVYFQDYDDSTGIMNGMYCYYGFNASSDVLAMLKPGNRIYIVGSLQYYETGGTYQIADPAYDIWGVEESCKLISTGNEIIFSEVSASDFVSEVEVERVVVDDDGNEEIVKKTFKYGELAMSSAISMKSLTVTSVYTTETGKSKGALTLTCKSSDDKTITVRTDVLYDSNNQLITADAYLNKTIDVKGFVDYFNGKYQIHVSNANNITVND